jgi:hypothetical protein
MGPGKKFRIKLGNKKTGYVSLCPQFNCTVRYTLPAYIARLHPPPPTPHPLPDFCNSQYLHADLYESSFYETIVNRSGKNSKEDMTSRNVQNLRKNFQVPNAWIFPKKWIIYIVVRLPLQPTTLHWEIPPMAVRAIPAPVCHCRIAR